MDTDRTIRRLQSRLYTSGVGTILFSLWSGIRDIQLFYTAMKEYSYVPNGIISQKTFNLALSILFFVLLAWSIFVHIYIGKKAMSVSLGKKSGNGYLVLSVLVLLYACSLYYSNLQSHEWMQLSKMKDIILAVIDVTANVILAEVVVFSVRLKRMRRKACR